MRNRSRAQRFGQAQQLVDGDLHRDQPAGSGDTPHENLSFLFFPLAVIQAVDTHSSCFVRRSRAPARITASAPTRRRRRSSRSSWAECRGDHLRDRRRQGRASQRRARSWAGHAGAAATAPALGRPQPHEPVRLHRQQVRVPRARLEQVASSQHGPQHDRRRGRRRPRGEARGRAEGGATSRRRSWRSSRTATRRTAESSSTATTTRTRGTRKLRNAGWRTCARRRWRCRG